MSVELYYHEGFYETPRYTILPSHHLKPATTFRYRIIDVEVGIVRGIGIGLGGDYYTPVTVASTWP